MNVIVIFEDDSPLTTSESVDMPLADAIASLYDMGERGLIKHIKELSAPDENGIGVYCLEVKYDSILMGAKLTLIS